MDDNEIEISPTSTSSNARRRLQMLILIVICVLLVSMAVIVAARTQKKKDSFQQARPSRPTGVSTAPSPMSAPLNATDLVQRLTAR